MTVGAVVLDLVGTVNSPGTQVTLTWSMSSDLVTVYTSNGEFQEPDTGVDLLTVQGVGGGQSGGVGNGSGSPPNWGSCGVGGQWSQATYLPSSLVYPVPVTVGIGGASVLWASQDSTGNPGTTTYFGNSTPVDWYLEAAGGILNQENPSFNSEQSSEFEDGGIWVGGAGGNTTNSGAAGGGSNYLGTGENNPGASADGPGGDGGSQGTLTNGQTGQPGFLYGGGGGGSMWNGGSVGPNSGAGASGILTVDATYTAADYYNVYRQGFLLASNVTSLSFVDSSPPTGTIIYEVIGVIGGIEQSQGAEYVTVDIVQPPVTVPNLIGLTSEAAATAIVDAGLVVSGAGVQVLDSGPYFVVVAQGPAAGTVVPVNTSVGYVIAVPPNWGGVGWDGQSVTYSGNVIAPAGIYGDQWGANGGGEAPIGGGVIGQTGWSDSVKVTISDAQRRESYLIGAPNLSVGSQMSDTQLDGHTPDDTLPTGGSLI